MHSCSNSSILPNLIDPLWWCVYVQSFLTQCMYQDVGIYFLFLFFDSFQELLSNLSSQLYPLPNLVGDQRRALQTSQLNVSKMQHMCIKSTPILWKELSQENNRKKTRHTHILSRQWYSAAIVHKRSKVAPRATPIHIIAWLPVQEPGGNMRDMTTRGREVRKV